MSLEPAASDAKSLVWDAIILVRTILGRLVLDLLVSTYDTKPGCQGGALDIAAPRKLHLETFCQVFHVAHPEPFGQHREGFHDGNEGVQWNAWADTNENGRLSGCVGVNLEGKEYDGWPIARLIERELGSFALFNVIAHIDHPEEITVRWTRDAWKQGGSREPEFSEQCILRVRLNGLTNNKATWQNKLKEAQGCLNHERGFRGRALRQTITVKGSVAVRDVSPHLNFIRELWLDKPPLDAELIKLMQEARRQLLPIHRMIVDLSRDTKITEAEAQRDIEAQEAEERYEEGGRSFVLVNRNERSRENRANAIRIHGTRCQACGFSFEEVYGERGRDYIEVHHLRSIASYGGAVQVDPEADMAVLCSNCHSMVHRRKDNPLTPEGLRTILRK